RHLVAHPAAVVAVLGAGLLEGVVVHGTLTYWPALLEFIDARPGLAGLAVGCFGLGVVAGSRWVSATARPRPITALAGGTTICLALLAAGFAQSLGVVVTLALAGVLGAGFAAIHSSLQSWATEAPPETRALVVAFFVAAVFLGGAAGAALAAGVVATRWFPLVYLVGAALAVPLT
ncbi:hypothetical protein, partial [Mycobacterium sp. NAZ190054]|uniref:hypothetical protein n=1 Tax=Mycobacterium sp. NAZ190054 TaxID=1747766 RepID=UPI000AD7279D